MHRVIVVEFISVDGVAEDPDGTQGFEHGGWAFRYGPQAVKGDKFKLGELWETGVLLFGRRTWQHFSRLWPPRSDDFANRLNRARKLVASRSLKSVEDWQHSALLGGDLVEEVRKRKVEDDIIVIGSDSVVQALMRHGLVDEYRLLVFPLVLGGGRRLFRDAPAPSLLRLERVEQVGEAALMILEVSK